MPERIVRKWRPPLALVIGGTLAAVLCLPLVGIAYFRVAGNVLGWAETSWLIGWMAVGSTLLLAFLLWRLVLRPVYALTLHARQIKAGQTPPPPMHFGTPELSELGQSVIDMGATLQNRAASLRAYADHVTHELKSPLTALNGAAELLGDPDLAPEDRVALSRTIQEASARMGQLLDDMRRHARASQGEGSGLARLSEVATGLEAGGLGIEVAQDGMVPLSPADLEAVLAQIAQNSQAHGAQRLVCSITANVLSLQDDGEGVSEGNKARIFDPFFTTRRDTGGTGMGLSIVRMLVEARGGRIELVSADRGACFEISF